MIESENIVKAVKWLEKFRKRLILLLLIPVLIAVAVYFASDYILEYITGPMNGASIYFMAPVEGVMAKLKVAVFGGLILSFPVLELLIAGMFSSLLSKSMKRKIYLLIIPFSSIALAGGILFGFKFIMPATVKFLLGSGEGFMKPMISGSNYVSFTTFFMLAIGIVFELPLILVALSRINVIKSSMLVKKRKVAIIITIAAMAVLTPTPDAFTLLAVSLPVILLYELSIWWIFILEKIDKRKNALI